MVDIEHGVCGTPDLIACINGRVSVIDLKRTAAPLVVELARARAAHRFGTGPASRVPAARLGKFTLQLHYYLWLLLYNTDLYPAASEGVDLYVLQVDSSLDAYQLIKIEVDGALLRGIVRARLVLANAAPPVRSSMITEVARRVLPLSQRVLVCLVCVVC